ncbi:MAG: S41 family peptidase [Bacillota bacterium]|nr:S41 family peptidase [Bacillota bacterium]
MFNKKRQRTIAIIIVWILAIAMIVTTFSFSVFAAGPDQPGDASEDSGIIGLAYGTPPVSENEAGVGASDADVPQTEQTAFSQASGEETAAAGTSGNVSGTIERQLKDMEEVLEYIEKTYVDDVDVNELIDGAYEGIFDRLDPYSKYYKDSGDGDSFMSQATGQFYGIGVVFENTDKGVSVKAFLADSPAAKAGIMTGDIMVSVDGISLAGKTASEAASSVRASKAATAVIVVSRNGENKTFRVERKLIESSSVSYKMADETTAYVGISNFYASTPEEFAKAWLDLKGNNSQMSSMIVDVRNNPGGLVSSAVTLSNLFLDMGCTIMNYTKDDAVVYSYEADGNKIVDVPVSLLVNKGTASAAEIFAGALQDNYAAVLVGGETYGKGMAQTVTELDSGASVKLSVYYFTTPDNHTIQGKGLTPSYIIYNGDNKVAISRYKEMKTVAPMDEGKKYKPGEKGLNVYAAQQRLIILGYDSVKLNGVLDEATVEAIRNIQKNAGVYVYGALDFTTIDCLEREYMRNVFGISEDIQLKKAIELTK